MTNEEAIKHFEDMKKGIFLYNPNELFDMAIKALEKDIVKDIVKEPAQTHKRYGQGYEYDDYYCPECDEFLAYEPQGNRYKQEGGWSRCKNCGQKIKWEVENDERRN